MKDPIELYQVFPTGDVISLGGTAQAETEVTSLLEKYPAMGIHVFFGTRVIKPCDPPVVAEPYWGTTRGYTDLPG